MTKRRDSSKAASYARAPLPGCVLRANLRAVDKDSMAQHSMLELVLNA